MRKVLVTGFDPFGGERLNPSWEVVKLLGDLELSGAQIVVRQLPCVFGKAIDALNAAIDEVHPEMVLCVGQAGGRSDFSVERVAINIDDARIPDNEGNEPVDAPIVAVSVANGGHLCVQSRDVRADAPAGTSFVQRGERRLYPYSLSA
jgi:pyroglutamyl-peptidase